MLSNRWKNYALWAAVVAFIPLLCESFGVNVLPANYQEASAALLGILVLAGIINDPTTANKGYKDDNF